jgi:hypothetical protein
MTRRLLPVVTLLFLAFAAGCSSDSEEFRYNPSTAIAEVRSASATPAVTAMVSVVGVHANEKDGSPDSIQIRMRFENNGSETVTFDPRTLDLTTPLLLPFPPPIVLPPGPLTVAPLQAGNLTVQFPLPPLPHGSEDLNSLQLDWSIQIGGKKVSQSVRFRRVVPSNYYYDPYSGYPYPYSGWSDPAGYTYPYPY